MQSAKKCRSSRREDAEGENYIHDELMESDKKEEEKENQLQPLISTVVSKWTSINVWR